MNYQGHITVTKDDKLKSNVSFRLPAPLVYTDDSFLVGLKEYYVEIDRNLAHTKSTQYVALYFKTRSIRFAPLDTHEGMNLITAINKILRTWRSQVTRIAREYDSGLVYFHSTDKDYQLFFSRGLAQSLGYTTALGWDSEKQRPRDISSVRLANFFKDYVKADCNPKSSGKIITESYSFAAHEAPSYTDLLRVITPCIKHQLVDGKFEQLLQHIVLINTRSHRFFPTPIYHPLASQKLEEITLHFEDQTCSPYRIKQAVFTLEIKRNV